MNSKQNVLVACVLGQFVGVIVLAILAFAEANPIATGCWIVLLGVVSFIEIYGNTHKFFKISNAIFGTALVVLGIMQLL
ncbi:MAG: hypothetical protein M0R80_25755 [Proteobacteria bacterium]|jgi:hypothetical protein|nr:hypothetical protein [Pseudomonadota bacterium]